MANESAISRRFLQAQNALVLQSSDLSLETIAAMVDGSAIDVDPQFQRRDRWESNRQSALIESFLLNIPVPPVYLAEEEFGSYSVIDGRQRITAIHSFMRNEYALAGLERFTEINELRFRDLPTDLRNALKVRPYIRAITILRQSDLETKYEVFHRLNSAGQPLNAQEIRNVIYRGPLNDLVTELSKSDFLRQQLKIRDERASPYRTMADIELVLRFLTLNESWQSFSGDFRYSMNEFMARNANPAPERLRQLARKFEYAVSACEAIWGRYAFKRPEKDGWRDQMLAGMYDAQMLAVGLIEPTSVEYLSAHSDDVLLGTRRMFDDGEFESSVRVATNTPSRLVYRVRKTIGLLMELDA